MSSPRLSVIMAVRNGAEHLEEAVASILGQSFRDFEFLIVDDGSDDATPEMLAQLAKGDHRIEIIRNDVSLGPYPSANRALEIARAPLIARMDADDISAPERLARQVAFLEARPDHMVVSSSYRAIDGSGRTLYVKRKPADDYCVKWWLRFRMCLEHPATCFRALLPDGSRVKYDESHSVAQDYELFSRLAQVGKMAVLPEVLFSYRVHDKNITATRKAEQKSNVLKIATANQHRSFRYRLPVDCARTYFMRSFNLLHAPAEMLSAFALAVDCGEPELCRAEIRNQPERQDLDQGVNRAESSLIIHYLFEIGRCGITRTQNFS